MDKRLIVTGYGGFVAGSIVWQARDGWDVHALSLDQAPVDADHFHCHQFDLRDTEKLRQLVATVKPHAIIHTAALADIDYCQAHQEDAEQTNVGVTREIARLSAETGAKMILCSTDSIFDGVKGLYNETDEPSPVNHYAETKVRAEQAVLGEASGAVVTRLSLVMGLPVLGVGNSFLAKMIASLESGAEVKFPSNEIRTPVDVITLGRAFLELATSDFTGIIHLAGNTRLDRYDMARRIARRLGFSEELVLATDSNAMPGRAPRPNDASLDNSLAKSTLKTAMKSLDEGLELVLESKEMQDNE